MRTPMCQSVDLDLTNGVLSLIWLHNARSSVDIIPDIVVAHVATLVSLLVTRDLDRFHFW